MKPKRKVRAQLERDRRKREALDEVKALAQKNKTAIGGFARRGTVARSGLKATTAITSGQANNLTRVTGFGPAKADPTPRDREVETFLSQSPRDVAAREQAERLRSRVAPLYNKGPYGYFSDDLGEDLRSGGGRRRS